MPSPHRASTLLFTAVCFAPLLLAASLFAGCSASESDGADEARRVEGYVEGDLYSVEWSFAEAPKVGEVEFTLFARRVESERADASMTGVEVTVEAWMPGHAHGLPDKPPVETVEPGHYQVSGLVLTMPGTWEIDVTVREGDVAEALTFSIEVE